jgi:hypothetical protein
VSAQTLDVTAYVYDAGALIAAERGSPRMWGLHRRALARGVEPIVPATVLAQVRRGRTPNLDRLLDGCAVVPLDQLSARLVGDLLAIARRHDIVDGHVVTCCLGYVATCVTSDRADIEHLAESARADLTRRFGRRRVPIVAI